MIETKTQKDEDDLNMALNKRSTVSLKFRSQKDILKDMLQQSIPYALNGIVIESVGIFRTLIFRQLGSDALAASALISISQLLSVGTIKGSLGSTGIIIARKHKKTNDIGIILQQSWCQALIESIPFITCFAIIKPIFIASGQTESVAKIASDYLYIYMGALPAISLLKSNEFFAVGLRQTQLILIISVINSTLGYYLSYVMAIGGYGVRGIAYAACISNWLSFIGMTLYFLKHPNFKKYNLLKITHDLRHKVLEKLFIVGVPLGFGVGIEASYMFALTTLVGGFGKTPLIAMQITSQFMSLFAELNSVIATIVSIMTSSDISQNNGLNVRNIGYMGYFLTSTLSLLSLILFMSIHQAITNLFLEENDKEYEHTVMIVKNFFLICCVSNFFDATMRVAAGGLGGFYKTVFPLMVTLCGIWFAGMPIGLFLAFTCGLGPEGLLVGRCFGLLGCATALLNEWFNVVKVHEKPEDNRQQSGFIGNFCSLFKTQLSTDSNVVEEDSKVFNLLNH